MLFNIISCEVQCCYCIIEMQFTPSLVIMWTSTYKCSTGHVPDSRISIYFAIWFFKGWGGGGEGGEREEERRILRDDVVLRGNSRGIGRLNRV